MSHTRNAKMKIKNNFGHTITDVQLTLSSSAHTPYTLTCDALEDGESSLSLPITFETGTAPAYDHWAVNFKHGSTKYVTPNDDRCNISSVSDGDTVEVKINKKSDCNFTVDVPDGCTFELSTN